MNTQGEHPGNFNDHAVEVFPFSLDLDGELGITDFSPHITPVEEPEPDPKLTGEPKNGSLISSDRETTGSSEQPVVTTPQKSSSPSVAKATSPTKPGASVSGSVQSGTNATPTEN